MFVTIVENIEISAGYFRLVIHSPELAENTKPGQFIMMKVGDNYDPLLRRPMGIHKISNKMLLLIFWVQLDKFWATVRRT